VIKQQLLEDKSGDSWFPLQHSWIHGRSARLQEIVLGLTKTWPRWKWWYLAALSVTVKNDSYPTTVLRCGCFLTSIIPAGNVWKQKYKKLLNWYSKQSPPEYLTYTTEDLYEPYLKLLMLKMFVLFSLAILF